LETSEAARKQLQTDLNASTESTIRAQASAKALEAENGLMKYGYIALGVAAGGLAIYEGGHSQHWW
jgi:hypothetical protein